MSHVYYPEIILGRRGPQVLMDFYRNEFPQIAAIYGLKQKTEEDIKTGIFHEHCRCVSTLEAAKREIIGKSRGKEEFLNEYDITARGIVDLNLFKKTPKVYKIGADFFQVLKNVDIAIPATLLPAEDSGYIIFPEMGVPIPKEDALRYHGRNLMPVEVDLEGVFYRSESDGEKRWLSLYFIKKSAQTYDYSILSGAVKNTQSSVYGLLPVTLAGTLHLQRGGELSLVIDIEGSVSIDSVITRLLSCARGPGTDSSPSSIESMREPIQAALNSILYIHSQKPDLQKTVVGQPMSQTKRKKLEKEGKHFSDLSIPVVNVGWNYKKQKIYHVDSSWVDSHPRWQRCGTGFSEVKLIWVAAHERKYNQNYIVQAAQI